ncbi:hypothetical protein [Spirosoma oryzicola]|uniref:phosphoketolase family protein n=1 Tax=Spirosoma oryzicola TaxID=2898794 RepID=UPI003CC65FC9
MNKVNRTRLRLKRSHSHGLTNMAFDLFFTENKLLFLAFSAYPWLIHPLASHQTIIEIPRSET